MYSCYRLPEHGPRTIEEESKAITENHAQKIEDSLTSPESMFYEGTLQLPYENFQLFYKSSSATDGGAW